MGVSGNKSFAQPQRMPQGQRPYGHHQPMPGHTPLAGSQQARQQATQPGAAPPQSPAPQLGGSMAPQLGGAFAQPAQPAQLGLPQSASFQPPQEPAVQAPQQPVQPATQLGGKTVAQINPQSGGGIIPRLGAAFAPQQVSHPQADMPGAPGAQSTVSSNYMAPIARLSSGERLFTPVEQARNAQIRALAESGANLPRTFEDGSPRNWTRMSAADAEARGGMENGVGWIDSRGNADIWGETVTAAKRAELDAGRAKLQTQSDAHSLEVAKRFAQANGQSLDDYLAGKAPTHPGYQQNRQMAEQLFGSPGASVTVPAELAAAARRAQAAAQSAGSAPVQVNPQPGGALSRPPISRPHADMSGALGAPATAPSNYGTAIGRLPSGERPFTPAEQARNAQIRAIAESGKNLPTTFADGSPRNWQRMSVPDAEAKGGMENGVGWIDSRGNMDVWGERPTAAKRAEMDAEYARLTAPGPLTGATEQMYRELYLGDPRTRNMTAAQLQQYMDSGEGDRWLAAYKQGPEYKAAMARGDEVFGAGNSVRRR